MRDRFGKECFPMTWSTHLIYCTEIKLNNLREEANMKYDACMFQSYTPAILPLNSLIKNIKDSLESFEQKELSKLNPGIDVITRALLGNNKPLPITYVHGNIKHEYRKIPDLLFNNGLVQAYRLYLDINKYELSDTSDEKNDMGYDIIRKIRAMTSITLPIDEYNSGVYSLVQELNTVNLPEWDKCDSDQPENVYKP